MHKQAEIGRALQIFLQVIDPIVEELVQKTFVSLLESNSHVSFIAQEPEIVGSIENIQVAVN